MVLDKVNLGIQGYVTIDRFTKGKKTHTEFHNLVVSNAREIVRDLVYGKRQVTGDITTEVDAPRIAYLVLGDGNQSVDSISIAQPTVDDKTLIRPTLWIPVGATDEYPNNSVEPIEFNGLKSIKYTFSISENQGNTISGFFCELGLALDNTKYPDSYLFTRITKTQPIQKSQDDALVINYYLSF